MTTPTMAPVNEEQPLLSNNNGGNKTTSSTSKTTTVTNTNKHVLMVPVMDTARRRRYRRRRTCILTTLWMLLLLSLMGCIWIVFFVGSHSAQEAPETEVTSLDLLKTKHTARGCEATVLLMRHCEKIGPDIVDTTHNQHCSYLGLERARYIKTLFGSTHRWPKPSYLYAVSPNRTHHLNFRQVETLLPLSEKLRVPIDIQYALGHEGDLAWNILHKLRKGQLCGRTLLISWEHVHMPNLARALGCWVEQGCPWFYPEDSFDEVWQLKYVYGPVTLYNPKQQEKEGPALTTLEDTANNATMPPSEEDNTPERQRHLRHATTPPPKAKTHGQWFVYGSVTQMNFDPLQFSMVNGDYPEGGTPMGGRWASPRYDM